MTLNESDLFLLSQCAISAACQAGHLISKYQHRKLSIDIKKGGSSRASQVVTEVDRFSQDIILQTLLPTCRTFDLAILAEESTDSLDRLKKDFFWCVDPLDGTLPFLEATPGYAVSIALVSRLGAPCIGVVYDPLEQTLYHAVKGCGAFKNGKPWKVAPSSPSTGHTLTFIGDRSFVQHTLFSSIVAELKNLAIEKGFDKGLNTILHGGATMNACWVLEKQPALYFKFPRPETGGGSLWDFAATACLFNEAGGVACDIYGATLDLNRTDSTFMNHRGILFSSNHEVADRLIALYAKLQPRQ